MDDGFAALFETEEKMYSITDNTTQLEFLQNSDVELSHKIFVSVTVLFIPIILLTNGLVFWATLLYPGFQEPHHFYLLSLSVADSMMGIWCIPMFALSYSPQTREWVYSHKYACLVWFASIIAAGDASLYNLLFIAIDRYVAVICPLKYRVIVTIERAQKNLIGLWVYILILAFLPMMGWNNYDPTIPLGPARCNFFLTLPKYYVYWAALGTVFTCIGVSAVLYIHIFIVVRHQIKAYRIEETNLRVSQVSQFENKMISVKVTAYLMFLFVFLWFPYLLIGPFKYYQIFSPTTTEILKVVAQILNVGNAMVNAPIYALCRSDFRLVYKLMLTTKPWQWKRELRVLYNLQASSVFMKQPNVSFEALAESVQDIVVHDVVSKPSTGIQSLKQVGPSRSTMTSHVNGANTVTSQVTVAYSSIIKPDIGTSKSETAIT